VVHTWGQQRNFYPHIHRIVSAGGMAKKQQASGTKKICWVQMNTTNSPFLFPVKAMSQVYRAVFIKEMSRLIENNERESCNFATALQTFLLLTENI
jgi:hypothetical protein